MSQSRNDCDRDDRPWSSSRVDTPRYSAGRISQKIMIRLAGANRLASLSVIRIYSTVASGRSGAQHGHGLRLASSKDSEQ